MRVAPSARPRRDAARGRGPRSFHRSAQTLAADIDTEGFACLDDAVTPEWLREARAYIDSRLPMPDGHELLVENFATGPAGFVERLTARRGMQALVEALMSVAGPQRGGSAWPMQADLRLVRGPAPAGKPPAFHYDGSPVTVVVPIAIPDGPPGQRGELILCPNRRPYRRFVITNVAEKSVTQNDVYRRLFVRHRARAADIRIVPLRPGNAYVFWGYRSYHATLPCRPNTLRATLILHYGNVHSDSALLAHTMTAGRTLRALSRAVTVGSHQYRVLSGPT